MLQRRIDQLIKSVRYLLGIWVRNNQANPNVTVLSFQATEYICSESIKCTVATKAECICTLINQVIAAFSTYSQVIEKFYHSTRAFLFSLTIHLKAIIATILN